MVRVSEGSSNDCVKMGKFENGKINLIRSGSLPSYERLKKNLLAKYRHDFRKFVKITRAKVDKNNKIRAGKEMIIEFLYSIRQDHSRPRPQLNNVNS